MGLSDREWMRESRGEKPRQETPQGPQAQPKQERPRRVVFVHYLAGFWPGLIAGLAIGLVIGILL